MDQFIFAIKFGKPNLLRFKVLLLSELEKQIIWSNLHSVIKNNKFGYFKGPIIYFGNFLSMPSGIKCLTVGPLKCTIVPKVERN